MKNAKPFGRSWSVVPHDTTVLPDTDRHTFVACPPSPAANSKLEIDAHVVDRHPLEWQQHHDRGAVVVHVSPRESNARRQHESVRAR
jgi:hypothetical protein